MTTPFPETSTNSAANFRDAWKGWSRTQRRFLLEGMSRAELELIFSRWDVFAHDHQVPPIFAPNGQPWLTWLLIGGRGAGKTRAGAEWVRAQALGIAPLADAPVTNIALVGELTVECAALWGVLVHEFWTGDMTAINALIGATGLLVSYWGFRFGVLGVYMSGRTREKVCVAMGQDTPGVFDKLARAVTGKTATVTKK